MNTTARSFGILTLATPKDYLKAIGLALSARNSNPGVPLAVACSAKVAPLVAPYFDHVIEEKAGIRGYAHKVWLDAYTPFDDTFFFDSDVLLFKDIRPFMARWPQQAYTACGRMMRDGFSAFGLDRQAVLRKLGKPELVVIDGAGHALFRAPGSQAVFDRAREVTARHHEFCGPIPYADEDVLDVVMTEMDLAPAPYDGFFSRYLSARPGSMRMDVTRSHCEYRSAETGEPVQPCMMHFAANEAPWPYHLQLSRLFRQHGVSTAGLWSQAAQDFWELEVRLRLHNLKKWLLRR